MLKKYICIRVRIYIYSQACYIYIGRREESYINDMSPISSTLNNVFMYSLNSPRAEKKMKNLSLSYVSCNNILFLWGKGGGGIASD